MPWPVCDSWRVCGAVCVWAGLSRPGGGATRGERARAHRSPVGHRRAEAERPPRRPSPAACHAGGSFALRGRRERMLRVTQFGYQPGCRLQDTQHWAPAADPGAPCRMPDGDRCVPARAAPRCRSAHTIYPPRVKPATAAGDDDDAPRRRAQSSSVQLSSSAFHAHTSISGRVFSKIPTKAPSAP